MKLVRFAIFTLLLSLGLSLPGYASIGKTDDPLAPRNAKHLAQRADFIAAREAIRNNQVTRYRKLAKGLQDYPLYPYLEYWYLNRKLNTASSKSIQAYLDRYPDSSLSDRLHARWLKKLAQQGKWQTFIKHYRPTTNTELNCYHRRALYKVGNKTAAFDGIEALWLVGKSQSRVCDPLFTAWRDAGLLTEDLAWQRSQLAMNNGQTRLARYLERFLSTNKQKLSQLWRQMHRHPEKVLKDPRIKRDSADNRLIVAHGVRRLARKHPSKAAETWNRLVMHYQFDEQAYAETESYIALTLARKHAPEATEWLNSLEQDSAELRKWRILTAVNQDDWDKALFWIEQLPTSEQEKHQWRYWQARAYQAKGMNDRAGVLYQRLARERNYYGFLAADQIDSGYEFENTPLQFSAVELAQAANLPGVVRTREFYALNDILNARREWYTTIKQLPESDMQKVGVLLHRWGWHDRAIMSMSQARYYDDLSIRFPLAHQQTVTFNASRQKVDPSWAYAVIRQESAFAEDARSHAGAMGLMQIMPNTGKMIARDLNTKLKSKTQLLEAGTNIRFGIRYLSKVMKRFDQNTVLATAAYNAGSQRVKSWLPKEEAITPDLWIENMPFKETRNYVKQVLAYTAIYDIRLKRPVKALRGRMPEIPARN